jgi:uncharacterized protein YeeX (DUF496 family)
MTEEEITDNYQTINNNNMNHFANNGKEYLRKKMTQEDIEQRQGRSRKQYENNSKVTFIATAGLFLTIIGIIIYGLATN